MKYSIRVKIIVLMTVLILITGSISTLLINRVIGNESHNQRLYIARAFFKQIVLTRRWVAQYGGVYVEKVEGVETNEHLEKIEGLTVEVNTDTDDIYTLRNPALATREISEIASEAGEFRFNITSLNPINPDNVADPFEVRSLNAFEEGAVEAWEYSEEGDRAYFRYMAPLIAEDTCLACHTDYKEGDIRGGISVSIPSDDFTFSTNRSIFIYSSFLVLSFMGILIALTAIFNRYFSKPITALTEQTKLVSEGAYDEKIMVQTNDEIGVMADAVETLRVSMLEAIREIQDKVLELEEKNAALVKAETMATISKLVSGVAHDLSTPLSVSITVASHLNKKVAELKGSFDDKKLTSTGLGEFIKECIEVVEVLEHNLVNSKELVHSFKTISVDQTSGQIREFELNAYIKMILLSLEYKYKRKNVKFDLHFDGTFMMKTYPGYISEVLNNLITNSMVHGFEDGEQGLISIYISRFDEENILIGYKESGVGISNEVAQRMFDMYYTTKKDSGGSGLGMHMVKQLVEGPLEGSICHIADGGTHFEIVIKETVKSNNSNLVSDLHLNE